MTTPVEFDGITKWFKLLADRRLELLRDCLEWMKQMDERYGDAPDYKIFQRLEEELE